MRNYYILPLLCLFLIILTSCSTINDPKKIEDAYRTYYDGISQMNFDKMRNVCSEDFKLFEDGKVLTVEDHIQFLNNIKGEGTGIQYSFKDIVVNKDRKIAWISTKNIAEAAFQGSKYHFEWLESAALKKVSGVWKLLMIHSTTAKPINTSQQNEEPEEKRIRKLYDDLCLHFSTGNWNEYAKLISQSSRLQVIHPENGSWIEGWRDFEKIYKPIITSGSKAKFMTHDMKIFISNSKDMAWGTIDVEIVPIEGKQTRSWNVFVAEKVDGIWKWVLFNQASPNLNTKNL